MISQKSNLAPEILWLGFTLTCTAGLVDAVGYLTLSQIYVANMSGNTVSVAVHLATLRWTEVWAHACPLLAFVPGLVAGDLIVAVCKRRGIRPALATVLLIEAAAAAAFVAIGHNRNAGQLSPIGHLYAPLVGLLAFSMGLQNGALRRIGVLQDLHTYVTGTLLATAHGLTGYLIWASERLRRPSRPRVWRVLKFTPLQPSLRSATVAFSLWLIYVAGAVAGTFGQSKFGVNTLLVPVLLLTGLSVLDIARPLRKSQKQTRNHQ